MMGTCAYPGCGRGFERKRSDARYCSDTCRAKASKDRARARRRASRARGAPVAGPGDAGTLADRLAAMEQRLTAAEAGVTRAEADRAGWKKVRDQLQAALGRVEGGGAVPAEKIAAAVRAEVGLQFATFGKRLEAVVAAQSALNEDLTKLRESEPPAKAAELMMVGKAVGKLATRVAIIERDLRAFSKGIVEAAGDEE